MKTIILAGGSGTRLFPLSRTFFPKQFIPFFNNESLFQRTLRRALLVSTPEECYVVTNEAHKFLVRDGLGDLAGQVTTLVEPEAKNTLPAVYYGTRRIVNDHGHSDVAVLPSDHFVTPDTQYTAALQAGEALAPRYLVTFGVMPDRPHTGYGYIGPGETIDGGPGRTIDRFVEKPDLETARRYLDAGYLWNSGIFVFNTELFLAECERCAPAVVNAFRAPTADAYRTAPIISIDHGIMEKTEKAAVVPFRTLWSDVGSFDMLYALQEKDQNRNVVTGEHLGIDSTGNLIIADRLIATIGLSDLVIVDTKDALLLCPRDRAQEVGAIVAQLMAKNDARTAHHTTVHRPWGTYTTLERGGSYLIKRVTVHPGKRVSLQLHHHRSEHWVVVKGMAHAYIDGREFFLRPRESTFVAAGVRHRIENRGLIPLEVIEVQNGDYVGEDDIVRFEDDFERVKSQEPGGMVLKPAPGGFHGKDQVRRLPEPRP